MRFHILTFDGGGIRGLFSAVVLQRLCVEHPALLPNCNLLAGTSTGGIIALALAAGKTPDEVVELYRDQGKAIFDDSWLDDLLDLGQAIGAQYDNRKLKKILQQQLGAKKLSGLDKRVLIPSFDLDFDDAGVHAWKPKFFHNFPGTDSDGGELAVDVALRTSAAPTYFPTYQGYVDGGVVANNPSMAAVAAALDARAGNQDLKDLVLLSISTGLDPKFIKGDNLDWGWSQWARPLVALMITGVSGVSHFQCREILGDRYQRVDQIFDRDVELDKIDDATSQYLIDQGNTVPLADAVKWLRNNWI